MTELGPGGADEDGVRCQWLVPGVGAGDPVRILAKGGHSTVVVGANGSGKSALGLWMVRNSGGYSGVHRLIAHRKLWFEAAGPGITAADREAMRSSVRGWTVQPQSRYLDHADGRRASIVLFDLLARVNSENAQMVEMYHAGISPADVRAKIGPPLLERINEILRAAELAVRLKLTGAQTFSAVNVNTGAEYPIFEMSDGEKSALLLAAEVLTVEAGVFIIDEPERHLHRSISAGLVAAIIADRPDDHFVVLTHDLELAAALSGETGQVYSLTSCTWAGQFADGWELYPVDASAEIPESARLAILGGRRKLLFIEGGKQSLDLGLYKLLFPDWAPFPAGGCDEVIRAVTGLRSSDSLHWLEARGVVDGDERTDVEKALLHARGIQALPVSEVENMYYSGVVMKAVAARQAASMDVSADILVAQAQGAALEALRQNETPERLAAKIALSVLRRRALAQLPTTVDRTASSVTVILPSPYPQLLARITALLETDDLEGLIRLVPIRDTGLRGRVAQSLRFVDFRDYETVARVLIRDDTALAAEVRAIVGPIPS